MNKEENYIDELFGKTEVTKGTEAEKPQVTEILKMPMKNMDN